MDLSNLFRKEQSIGRPKATMVEVEEFARWFVDGKDYAIWAENNGFYQ